MLQLVRKNKERKYLWVLVRLKRTILETSLR